MFSHKNFNSPLQSRMMVWALKTFIHFLMKKKNNPWQKFNFPQKAQLLCKKKSSGLDNVVVDTGNGKRENPVILKCHLGIFFHFQRQRHLYPAQQPRSHQGEFPVGCYGLQNKSRILDVPFKYLSAIS